MTIKKVYRSNISCDDLFQAWISTEMAIEPITKIECEPIVGGKLKLYTGLDLSSAAMIGTFDQVIQNELLQYTWNWVGSDETTVIRVTFRQADKQAVVELEHSGFLTKESMEMHSGGWDSYFSGLEQKISEVSKNP